MPTLHSLVRCGLRALQVRQALLRALCALRAAVPVGLPPPGTLLIDLPSFRQLTETYKSKILLELFCLIFC